MNDQFEKLALLPVSGARAAMGIVSLVLITFGAGALWGIGGALLALGLVIYIDTASDEAVERFTRTKRAVQR